MEFPFGHNHSHTHHHRNDDEDNRERPPPPPPHLHHNEFAPPSHHYPPPPPSFDGPYPPTPYPPVPPPSSYFQQPGYDGPSPPNQPPPYFQQPGFPSPPQPPHQPPHVTHVHHQQPGYDGPSPPYFQQPGFPSPPHQPPHVTHGHHSGGGGGSSHHQQPEHGFRPHLPPEFHKKPTYKIYCKADPGYHLTIRDGHVILAPSNPSDEFQHWYKDEKFSTRVKDEVGFPSFSLVNKATGQAIKHSIGASHPVQLVPYKPDHLDESVLWSESLEVHDGYRAIRMINNIRLNVDALQGDKKSGGVRNGTTVVLWQWNKGDNQIWKISPYCKLEKIFVILFLLDKDADIRRMLSFSVTLFFNVSLLMFGVIYAGCL